MPLNKGCSKAAFDANMHALKEEGKENPQMFAIGINTLKDACGVKDVKKKMSIDEILSAGGASEKSASELSRLASTIEKLLP